MIRLTISKFTSREEVIEEMKRDRPRWAALKKHNLITAEDLVNYHNSLMMHSFLQHVTDFIENGNTVSTELLEVLVKFDVSYTVNKLLCTADEAVDIIIKNKVSPDNDKWEHAFRKCSTEYQEKFVMHCIENDFLQNSYVFRKMVNVCAELEDPECLNLIITYFLVCDKKSQAVKYRDSKIHMYLTAKDFMNSSITLNDAMDHIQYLKISTEEFDEKYGAVLREMDAEHRDTIIKINHESKKRYDVNTSTYLLKYCSPAVRMEILGNFDWNEIDLDECSLKQRVHLFNRDDVPGWFLQKNQHYMMQLMLKFTHPALFGHIMHHELLMSKLGR